MAAANLQTIIVSKTVAKTRAKAERLARPHARRIYTSRETSKSWRFRQRPDTDFKKGTFHSFPLPGHLHHGITLVYGDLKASKKKNPKPKGKKVLAGRQRHFQYVGKEGLEDINRDWDFWLEIQSKIAKTRSRNMIQVLALSTRRRRIQSETIKGLIMGSLADRARELRFLRTRPTAANDERYYNELVGDNPKRKPKKKTKKKRAKKKATKKKRAKKPSYIKLKDPKVMPDPGPCGWMGSSLEFAIKPNGKKKPRWAMVDENGNWLWEGGLKKEWLFLWSPKYKAIIGIRRPRGLKGGPGRPPQTGKVIRDGRGAKMFEVFSGRNAEQTQEIEIDEIPLQKWGVSEHYVYRSDKWDPKKRRKTTDYIHDLGKGVKIYCGPTIANPKVFLCFGGKLTLTERGLVF
jgi:hypothetical protein